MDNLQPRIEDYLARIRDRQYIGQRVVTALINDLWREVGAQRSKNQALRSQLDYAITLARSKVLADKLEPTP